VTVATKQALTLKTRNFRLNRLTGALRKQGFVPKWVNHNAPSPGISTLLPSPRRLG
jgi:hypothetical protein